MINARGVRLSGSKLEGKLYQHHSGYPGGLKTVSYDRLMPERSTMVVEKAVRGMLPKNRLGRKMIGKLAVYEGAEHPHAAQSPVPLGLGEIPPWTGLPAPPEPKAPAERKTAEPKSRARSTRAPRAGSASAARRPRVPSGPRGQGSRRAEERHDPPLEHVHAGKEGDDGGRREEGVGCRRAESGNRVAREAEGHEGRQGVIGDGRDHAGSGGRRHGI